MSMVDPALIGRPGREHRSRPLLRTALGDVLRRTRIRQGRTLTDVAGAAKVSMPYLSELERGRKEASSEVLAAICGALGIELAELLAMVESDLVAEHAQVLRLGTVRLDGAPPQSRGAGDITCLLAA